MKDTNPDSVRVELYANVANGEPALHLEMTRLHPLPDEAGGYAYSATISSVRPATDYTARIISKAGGLNVPLEAGWILWQR